MPFSYDTGTISGILAMDYFQNLFSTGYIDTHNHKNVSPSQTSAIVSILSAGTFFGALSSPFLADNIGRRLALIASTCVFILGVIFQTAATALPLFLAGRFFAGFGVGLISALSKCHDVTYTTVATCSNSFRQFRSINPRPPPSGFVVLLSGPTSLLSLLDFCSQPSWTMRPLTSRTPVHTVSQLPFNLLGPSSSLAAWYSYPRHLAT